MDMPNAREHLWLENEKLSSLMWSWCEERHESNDEVFK